MIGLQRFSEIPKRFKRFHCTHFAATDLDKLYSGLRPSPQKNAQIKLALPPL